TSVRLLDIGPIPDGYTEKVPPEEFPKWNGNDWVVDINAKNQAELESGREQLVQDKIRQIAIDQLIAEGKLPEGYK
ncbi:MAG: hypothetical protein PVG65_04450, partial [Candidatus Thorarchaeota archaeon]